MKRILLTVSLLSLSLLAFSETQPIQRPVTPGPVASYDDRPSLQARAAILLDASTGEDLYEKNADTAIPPASLTKLMTIHLTYKAIAAGKFTLDTYVPIHAEDCAPEIPYHSSLMFLQAGMTVTVRELLQGLAVASGNDAAFALGRFQAGSLEAFAKDMNAEAQSLGLTHTHFVEPSGISEKNYTTARDFAYFCSFYLKSHPNVLTDLHSLPSINFPQRKNFPKGMRVTRPVFQHNGNKLLASYAGCDGLKTGYIDESGYNIALTAQRDGTRLIAVILGGYGSGSRQGYTLRTLNGQKILNYGFEHFKTVRPEIKDEFKAVRVWKGKANQAGVAPLEDLALTAPLEDASAIHYEIQCDPEVVAPVSKGQTLGEIVFSANGRVLKRIPLGATADVARGNIFKVAVDSVKLFFKNLSA